MGTSSGDMSASSDLLWALTKKNNAFLCKRNGLQLSSEPGNLMNKNSFKYSGLANLDAVDIQDNTKGITLSKKNKKESHAPKRTMVAVDLKKGFRAVANTITKKTEGSYYRKDLKGPALARWYKVWKSQNKGAISKD